MPKYNLAGRTTGGLGSALATTCGPAAPISPSST
jgi:hypothetical protein